MYDNLLDPIVMEQSLSDSEKAVRDKFVEEYLKDKDAYLATIRTGYLESVALNYAQIFLRCTYVQRKIQDAKYRPQVVDPKIEKQNDFNHIKNTLRQAMDNGPYASRVAAAAKLSSLYGFDQHNNKNGVAAKTSGVMVVPAIASLSEWESEAMKTQSKLVEDTSNG